MMDAEKLKTAIREATRFISAANVAMTVVGRKDYYPGEPHKEVAAAKRASMDLTRALSAMRKSY